MARRHTRHFPQKPTAWYVLAFTHFHPWFSLVLIITAELLGLSSIPQLSMVLHALLLVMFTTIAVTTAQRSERRLALALMLVPLIRILSLSFPLIILPQITWPTLIGFLVLCSAVIVRRELHLNWRQVGLRGESPFTVLLLMVLGLGLGTIEAKILPMPAVAFEYSWVNISLFALSFVIFTGFTEEFVFRGLIQSVVPPVLGSWGFVYGSLLFAALHIGYGSAINLVFVFAVGLFFSEFVQSSKSLVGVSLSHGIANITQLLLIPYLVTHPASQAAQILLALIWLGSAFSLVMLSIVITRRARQYGRTWQLHIEIY